jgi:hypothetical protein
MGVAGWRIIQKWTAQFRKGGFSQKLAEAKRALKSAAPRAGSTPLTSEPGAEPQG